MDAAPGARHVEPAPGFAGSWAGTTRAITTLITTPTGTLMKKFQRQPAYDVSTPPSLDYIKLATSNDQQHLIVMLPADQTTADKLRQLR